MDAHKEPKDEIAPRPVTDDDREFLLEAYAAGREIELAAVPWDDAMKRTFVEHQYAAQDLHYRNEYPESQHEVILFNGQRAGRIYLHRSSHEIAILDMAVLPGFRRQGIATTIVERLQDEARPNGQSVYVFVEVFNPASALFTGLGFVETSTDGISRRFDWHPGRI